MSVNKLAMYLGIMRHIKVIRKGGGGLFPKLRLTLVSLWTVACQAPLSMGFSRQEYWSGLQFASNLDKCKILPM